MQPSFAFLEQLLLATDTPAPAVQGLTHLLFVADASVDSQSLRVLSDIAKSGGPSVAGLVYKALESICLSRLAVSFRVNSKSCGAHTGHEYP